MGLIDKNMQPEDEQLPAPEDTAGAPPVGEGAEAPADDQPLPEEEGTPSDTAAPAEEEASGSGALTVTPQMIEEKLTLQPKEVPQLKKIVIAGMKVMFDPKTHKLMLDQMQGDGDIPTKLGQGITGLIGMLMQESQNSLPPQLLVPAGLVLMAHAAEFLDKTGTPVSDQDFGDGVHVFTHTILHAAGVDSDKLAELAAKQEQQVVPDAAAPADAPPPAAGGLINQGMQQ